LPTPGFELDDANTVLINLCRDFLVSGGPDLRRGIPTGSEKLRHQ